MLREPGGSLTRQFTPRAAELAFEGIEFTSKPIRVSVDLQNVGEDIVGDLRVSCELSIECGRCVERCSYAVEADRQIEYLTNPTAEAMEAEMDGWFVSQYDGERVVLDDDVWQMLLLALPMRFLCREDCRGLCPRCGANLNRRPCGCPPLDTSRTQDHPLRSALNDILRKKKL
ncbi:MAG: hypothetical protein A3G34_06830 [Candidatus Lindowbacteria bacterium RIFCSPLOWO2_12_FULL_62_27]|nr:MAG: hypothetical protein A3G34_06830 [Candidatus Lindowbacteria bacterium RIFCSPLOWO2_12_FULL_62_27]OGH63791.1 MAG: hypothetical protein A3I06_12605 [Candidatus Lindowbacteria bacterium RIFCSPLOWO2_02_FULL_62_12]